MCRGSRRRGLRRAAIRRGWSSPAPPSAGGRAREGRKRGGGGGVGPPPWPDRAPAKTSTGPGGAVTAWRCCGFRPSRRSIGTKHSNGPAARRQGERGQLRPARPEVEVCVCGEEPRERARPQSHHPAVGKVGKVEVHLIAGGFAGDRHQAGGERLIEAEGQSPQVDEKRGDLADGGVARERQRVEASAAASRTAPGFV